jgi:cytochrome P450
LSKAEYVQNLSDTYSLLIHVIQGSQYVEDLQAMMPTVNKRIELSPFFDLMFLLPLPQVKKFSERFQRILKYWEESIRRLQLAQLTGSLDTTIFFDKIISPKNKENTLSELEMQQEAAELMITGTDTTSNTLTYLVWSVLQNPRIRARLEEEVSVLSTDFKDADLVKLPYLNAVGKESLRLYGAASGAHQRDVLEGGWEACGYMIPDTATVFTQAFSLHRLPEVFPSPHR